MRYVKILLVAILVALGITGSSDLTALQEACGDMQNWVEEDLWFDDEWHAGAGNENFPSECGDPGSCEWAAWGPERYVDDYHFPFVENFLENMGHDEEDCEGGPGGGPQ